MATSLPLSLASHEKLRAFVLARSTNPEQVPTPHEVRVDHLCDEALGVRRYERELHARFVWCRENCGAHDVEAVYADLLTITGRVFRFASRVDALRFRARFPAL